MMNKNTEMIMKMMDGYSSACVLGAASELDLFSVISNNSMKYEDIAKTLKANQRGVKILLDALVSIRLIEKKQDLYNIPKNLIPYLIKESPNSLLAGIRHRSNMIRGWIQLAKVVKTGNKADPSPSILGIDEDSSSFINAMHVFSTPNVKEVVSNIIDINYSRFLDLGGASGTWTLALLEQNPEATATIFDLPHAIDLAKKRIQNLTNKSKIDLISGDFYKVPLPQGFDMVWVSAIIHQHSRAHNRTLFKKVFNALDSKGSVIIRDIIMEPSHTSPPMGAMFAINMLVHTESGSTFTFEEVKEDLTASGFEKIELCMKSEDMNSLIVAYKP